MAEKKKTTTTTTTEHERNINKTHLKSHLCSCKRFYSQFTWYHLMLNYSTHQTFIGGLFSRLFTFAYCYFVCCSKRAPLFSRNNQNLTGKKCSNNNDCIVQGKKYIWCIMPLMQYAYNFHVFFARCFGQRNSIWNLIGGYIAKANSIAARFCKRDSPTRNTAKQSTNALARNLRSAFCSYCNNNILQNELLFMTHSSF